VGTVTQEFGREWNVLASLVAARDELRAIRSALWASAFRPTKEVLHVDRIDTHPGGWSADPAGEVVVFEISVDTTMPDGHDIESTVSLLLSPDGWRVETEVTALNDAVTILWRGSPVSGAVMEELAPTLLASARQVVESTLSLDVFKQPETG
jgi:hypothetical protein